MKENKSLRKETKKYNYGRTAPGYKEKFKGYSKEYQRAKAQERKEFFKIIFG